MTNSMKYIVTKKNDLVDDTNADQTNRRGIYRMLLDLQRGFWIGVWEDEVILILGSEIF